MRSAAAISIALSRASVLLDRLGFFAGAALLQKQQRYPANWCHPSASFTLSVSFGGSFADSFGDGFGDGFGGSFGDFVARLACCFFLAGLCTQAVTEAVAAAGGFRSTAVEAAAGFRLTVFSAFVKGFVCAAGTAAGA